MKQLILLFIAVILMISLGLWVNHSLDVASKDLNQSIKLITKEVEEGNWQEAKGKIEQLEKQWQVIGSWWPVVLDHQEIDNIEFSLAKVKEYVAAKNKALSMGGLSELKLMILHLPEKETVNLKNIL
ncbi:DUF4363 family protein [Desulfotomaculum defluvii]